MRRAVLFLSILFCSGVFTPGSHAQKCSLILLGDLHYDRMEDHYMGYFEDKPGDLRQVREYTEWTENHWEDFMEVIRKKTERKDYPAVAILQAGDLSEGLAGSEALAEQMARHSMEAIETTRMPVPWILAKGNHDITGPGAKRAFTAYYLPMIRKQTGRPDIRSANYSYQVQQIKVVCLDPWDRDTDPVEYLDRELSGSEAKYKFVLVHEPLIPVTERCSHLYREEPEKREKILEIIGRNGAIVFCGHLHRYSVVRRTTATGPVMQVMAVSVVRERDYLVPAEVIRVYGPSLAEERPDWQPETLETRKAMLAEEARYVTFYQQTDLPGYARITINPGEDQVNLEYYAAFGKEPFDTVDLSSLQNP